MAHGCSLYLVRHAIAAERGEEYPDDSKRPLTSDGAAKFRKAARGLAELGVEVEAILTSPFTRARQTAELLAAELSGHPQVIEVASLEPGMRFEQLVDALKEHRGCATLALVGHEPGIGAAAARLIGSETALEFKKGAVCRIDVEACPPSEPGALRWFMTQKILKGLKT